MRKNIINSSNIIDLNTIGNVRYTPPVVNNNIVLFDGTSGTIKDSGSSIADLGDVKTNGSAVNENIIVYDGTSGDSIKDSGINKSVLVSLPTFTWNSTSTFTMVPSPSGSNVNATVTAVLTSGTNDMVTLCIDPYIGSMSSIASFTSSTALDVALRPSFSQRIPILTFTDIGEVDSDVVGTALINTNGTITIYKENPPGSATFNGLSVGWGSISLSYRA